ncbi:hypothetical protein Aduo_002150 [Ancylostoma duodenale]
MFEEWKRSGFVRMCRSRAKMQKFMKVAGQLRIRHESLMFSLETQSSINPEQLFSSTWEHSPSVSIQKRRTELLVADSEELEGGERGKARRKSTRTPGVSSRRPAASSLSKQKDRLAERLPLGDAERNCCSRRRRPVLAAAGSAEVLKEFFFVFLKAH